MEKDNYLTLEGSSQGLYKEKGSKFLGFAYSIESEEEAKKLISDLKREYHDARHHCYAFILGPEQEHYRSHDAGEPTHSAGDPILGQIRSKGLTNTLVVVVRYFGGTKLGIPGLTNAYKSAASDALEHARIVERTVKDSFQIRFGYEKMNEVMRLIKDFDIEIANQDFGMDCRMELRVRKSQTAAVKEKFRVLAELNKQN